MTHWVAAERLGVTDRWVRKLPVQMKKHGNGGIVLGMRGRVEELDEWQQRRSYRGELVQSDTSVHDWLPDSQNA